MFSKKAEKLEAFIGHNSVFTGDVRTKGTLRVDGTLEGNVEADWLIVGDKGRIKGNATARGIIVGGTIEGNLQAKETVEIKHKGQVLGDISTPKLTVLEGGMLNGRTIMQGQQGRLLSPEGAQGK
jgi:cytoskeletal protein CcmA (bactofilin family)